jgi:hypothetical protein
MPTTTTHAIYYPSGTAVPNIPVQDQTQAESVEAALNKITKAPLIICEKTNTQSTGAAGVMVDVTWDLEIHKQGITHAASSASFTVTEAGIYQINARVAFTGETGTGALIANVNGVDKINTRTDQVSSVTAWPKPAFTSYVKLNANDIVKIRCAHTVANTVISSSESSFQLSKVVTY